MTKLVIWTTVWALAFVASAIIFKGNPVKDWIQSALFVFLFIRFMTLRPNHRKRTL